MVSNELNNKAEAREEVLCIGHSLYIRRRDVVQKPLFYGGQYVLMPTHRRILVFSTRTGKCIHILSPQRVKHHIVCMCICTLVSNNTEEHVLLVSLSSCDLVEFSLADLEADDRMQQFPRRKFKTIDIFGEKHCAIRLSSPRVMDKSANTEGSTAYALLDSPIIGRGRAYKLMSFHIPSFQTNCDKKINVERAFVLWGDIHAEEPVDFESFVLNQKSSQNDFENVSENSLICHICTNKSRVFVWFHDPPLQDAETPLGITVYGKTRHAEYVPFLKQGSRSDYGQKNVIRSCAVNVQALTRDMRGADVALGTSNGKIFLIFQFIETLLFHFRKCRGGVKSTIYGDLMKTNQRTLMNRIENGPHILSKPLHWHYHSVLTVTFHTPTLLISGGEEAVMISWSLIDQHDSYKPSHTFPRILSGDIMFLASTSSTVAPTSRSQARTGILIIGRNNRLVYVSVPDYNIKWFVQGFASADGEGLDALCWIEDKHYKAADKFTNYAILPDQYVLKKDVSRLTRPKRNVEDVVKLIMDPRTKSPVCANLPGHPGAVHWYNTSGSNFEDDRLAVMSGCVQVVLYNRMSRPSLMAPPEFHPRVTHVALSGDGETMVTVDVVLKQIPTIGRQLILHGEILGETTTLKFWSLENTSGVHARAKTVSLPSHMTDIMTHPHGQNATIADMALSTDGKVVVTSSEEENCIRIWMKRFVRRADKTGEAWKCTSSLKTPSGLASPGLLKFSPDCSLVAVAHHDTVLIWDHGRSELLRRIRIGGQNEKIFEMDLDVGGLLIVCTHMQVSCHSIMKVSSSTSECLWAIGLGGNVNPDIVASCFTYIPNKRQVAIAFYSPKEKSTQVILVDVRRGRDVLKRCMMKGKVTSMCHNGSSLYLLDNFYASSELRVAWQFISPETSIPAFSLAFNLPTTSPQLPALELVDPDTDKKRHIQLEPTQPFKQLKTLHGLGAGNVLSSDLPTLSGNFVRAFARLNGNPNQ